MERALQWLYPGLRIKRWLLLALSGFGMALVGFVLFAGPDMLYFFGYRMARFLADLRGSPYSLLLLAAGLLAAFWGLQRASAAAGEVLLPRRDKSLIDLLYTKRYLEGGPRLVAVGGGTGLSTLLREMKEHTGNLTAVVTVTDDGGSSGRLRGALGMPPPGDIRSCLLALADTEPIMEKLFQHRFSAGEGLAGHSFGNLFIAAMTEMFGFQEALRLFGRVLAIRGRVLPVTLDPVRLEAEDVSGSRIRGQSAIYQKKGPLKRVFLEPARPAPLPEVLEAIETAAAVVLGPGSLYSSVIPNLLVPGVAEALRRSRAYKIFVCNVLTQPGETTGFSAADHLQAIFDHTMPGWIDCVVVNSDLALSRSRQEPFLARGAALVKPDYPRLRRMAPQVVSLSLISRADPACHDAARLSRVIMELVSQAGVREGWRYRFRQRLRRNFPGSA